MEKEINKKDIRKIIIKTLICLISLAVLTILIFIKPAVNSVVTKIYYIVSYIASLSLVLFIPIIYKYIIDKKVNKHIVKLAYEISDFFSIFIIACCLIQSFFVFGYFRAEVSGDSMLPNFTDGETLIGKSTTNVENFDVIILSYSKDMNGGAPASLEDGELLIKRLIAKGGDTFYIKDGYLYLNGVLQEEKYLKREYYTTVTLEEYLGNGVRYDESSNQYFIEDGYYFAMGDNRNISYDSRDLGLFSEEQLVGKIVFRVNSLFDWEKLS